MLATNSFQIRDQNNAILPTNYIDTAEAAAAAATG